MMHFLVTKPVCVPCISLGSGPSESPLFLRLAGNATFSAVPNFVIMSMATHRPFSVGLCPSFCLHSLRAGGVRGGIMPLNPLRICERTFVSVYGCQQLLYCNKGRRRGRTLATHSFVLSCNEIIERLSLMQGGVIVAM